MARRPHVPHIGGGGVPIVDDHGHLHNPHSGEFMSPGGGSAPGWVQALEARLSGAKRPALLKQLRDRGLKAPRGADDQHLRDMIRDHDKAHGGAVAPRSLPAPRMAEIAGRQHNLDELEADAGLAGKTTQQLKAIADANNVTFPAAVKTAPARRLHLLRQLMEHEKRNGGGDARAIRRLREAADNAGPSGRLTGTEIVQIAGRLRDQPPEHEALGILASDPRLTSANLRKVADVLGVAVPPDMRAKTAIQMHLAETVSRGELPVRGAGVFSEDPAVRGRTGRAIDALQADIARAGGGGTEDDRKLAVWNALTPNVREMLLRHGRGPEDVTPAQIAQFERERGRPEPAAPPLLPAPTAEVSEADRLRAELDKHRADLASYHQPGSFASPRLVDLTRTLIQQKEQRLKRAEAASAPPAAPQPAPPSTPAAVGGAVKAPKPATDLQRLAEANGWTGRISHETTPLGATVTRLELSDGHDTVHATWRRPAGGRYKYEGSTPLTQLQTQVGGAAAPKTPQATAVTRDRQRGLVDGKTLFDHADAMDQLTSIDDVNAYIDRHQFTADELREYVREELADLSRDEQDAALMRLALTPGVHVVPWDNRKALTDADRRAALRIGGADSHVIRFEDPTLRPPSATARQVDIDTARPAGDIAAQVAELERTLLDSQVGADEFGQALGERVGNLAAAARANLRPGGRLPEGFDAVEAAARSGDPGRIRAAVADMARRNNVTVQGAAYDRVQLDRGTQRLVADDGRTSGPVTVIRPRVVLQRNGETIELSKAVVADVPDVERSAARERIARTREAHSRPRGEEQTRRRQDSIDRARGVADMLAELDELADNEAGTAVLGRSLATRARQHPNLPAGLVNDLTTAAADPAGIAAVIDRYASEHGLTRISGPAGGVEPFDPTRHRALGARPERGTLVRVVRPGWQAQVDGEQVRLMHAVVEEATPQEIRDYRRSRQPDSSPTDPAAAIAQITSAATVEDLLATAARISAMPPSPATDRALRALDEELARREGVPSLSVQDDDHSRRLDDLMGRGWSYLDAYAEVRGLDPATLARDQRMSSVDAFRRPGESRAVAIRRMYREFVAVQWAQAEADTRGHLLSAEGQRRQIDPTVLWSAAPAQARRYASEELKRWWEAHGGRATFVQWSEQFTGRRAAAQASRLAGSGRDFGL